MSGTIRYTIRPYDTIWMLAQVFNTTVDSIMELNPGINPRNLQIGQVITLAPGYQYYTSYPEMPAEPLESGTESGMEEGTGTGMGPGMGQGTGTGMGPGMGQGTGTGMGPGTGQGAGTGMGPGMGQGTGTGMGPGMGQGTGTGMRPGTSQGAGTGMGSGTGQGTGTGMGSGTGQGTGTGMGSGTGQGTGTGMRPGTGQSTGTGMGSGTGQGTGTGMRPGTGQGTGTGMGSGMDQGTGSSMEPRMDQSTGSGMGPGMDQGMDTGMEGSMMMDLASYLRLLWDQHVEWTRMAVMGIVHNLPEADLIQQRLLRNPIDFADALAHFYGEEAAQSFAELLTEHLTIAAGLVKAAMAGDNNTYRDLEQRWYDNADQIAALLASINPYWSVEDWDAMLEEHLNLLAANVAETIAQNYAESINGYDEIELQALEMADMMAEGISMQFPG